MNKTRNALLGIVSALALAAGAGFALYSCDGFADAAGQAADKSTKSDRIVRAVVDPSKYPEDFRIRNVFVHYRSPTTCIMQTSSGNRFLVHGILDFAEPSQWDEDLISPSGHRGWYLPYWRPSNSKPMYPNYWIICCDSNESRDANIEIMRQNGSPYRAYDWRGDEITWDREIYVEYFGNDSTPDLISIVEYSEYYLTDRATIHISGSSKKINVEGVKSVKAEEGNSWQLEMKDFNALGIASELIKRESELEGCYRIGRNNTITIRGSKIKDVI